MNAMMKFDPATGRPQPYPSAPDQWREFHGGTAWLYNPWTGAFRAPRDIGSDVFGLAIVAPGTVVDATIPAPIPAPAPVKRRPGRPRKAR